MSCLWPHLRECGLAHTSEGTVPHGKEGKAKKRHDYMCWPGNRIGKASVQLAAFSLKKLLSLCGVPLHICPYGITALWAPRGPGDNLLESDLSLYHGIQWSNSCLRLVQQALYLPSHLPGPCGSLWFSLGSPPRLWDGVPQIQGVPPSSVPGNTFAVTHRGVSPSSVQCSQVGNAWPLPAHSPPLAMEAEAGERRRQAK